jgi:hypothetical protein
MDHKTSEEGIEVVHTVNRDQDPRLCLQDEDDPTGSTDCKSDESVLWRISYQSIMNAFGCMFIGQSRRAPTRMPARSTQA